LSYTRSRLLCCPAKLRKNSMPRHGTNGKQMMFLAMF